MKQAILPDHTPSGAQGWFLNLRRPQFSDPRVREALSYAFDFEWTNKNLMFDAYKRTTSFFENSDLKAEGPAGPDELALIAALGDRITPEEVAVLKAPPWLPPVSDGSGQDRALLRKGDAVAARGRLGDQGRPADQCRGQGLHHRVPRRRERAGAPHRALHQEPQAAWASRPISAWSIRRNTSAG